MKKVAMIGVGKLGQDCAEVMADAGYDVVGYDVEPRNPAFPMRGSIEDAVIDRDIIFIAAPTPHDSIYGGETPTSHLPNKDFDYTIVTDILKEVNRHVSRSQLVVLISTVLPGTVRSILEPCITNARFIYNPYLIAMGTVKWDMVNPEMVIIGTEDGSLTGDASELIDFYKVFMQNDPRYEVGTWDEAESIKIFYNTFISTKLALVNMIQDVAETNGNINVDVVTNALKKSTYRIMGPAYMQAALGDAGACHPRDNIALRYLADRLDLGYDLFDAIMKAREVQAERMALRCLKNGKNITIIGKAYKPKVPYLNGSASMLVGHYIEKHGGNLHYYDPNTGDNDLRQEWTEVYLIGYWEKYVEDINFKYPETVVIDPWRKITSQQHSGEIIHYGDTRTKKTYAVPNTTVESMKSHTYEMFPELKQYHESIHVVDATINFDTTFILRPTENLVSELKQALSDGKSKFIFFAATEAFMPHVVGKIHRLVNLFNGEIKHEDVFMVTTVTDGDQVYDDVANKMNWVKKINLLNGNFFNYITTTYARGFEFIGGYEPRNKGKIFLCFNKLNREHRMRLVNRMLAMGLVDKGYYSFEGEDNFKDIISDLDDNLYSYIKLYQDSFPMKLNITPDRTNPVDIRPDDLHYHKDSYFSIVTETLFYNKNYSGQHHRPHVEDSMFFTEKTYRCFALLHPFILMARPHSLKELRKQGYKTFAPFIDESYDDIEDDDLRFETIIKEIKRLSNYNGNEWVTWQEGIRSIVEYNQEWFHTNKSYSFTKNYEALFTGTPVSSYIEPTKIFTEFKEPLGTVVSETIEEFPKISEESFENIITVSDNTDYGEQVLDWANKRVTTESGYVLNFPVHLDGGGDDIKSSLLEFINSTGKKVYERALDWCAGHGPFGFELLDKKKSNFVVFQDIYDVSTDTCIQNAKENNISHLVNAHTSSTISGIPSSERFDLVVANPPHCGSSEGLIKNFSYENTKRILVDEKHTAHKEFFKNIKQYLTHDADIYITVPSKNNDHFVRWAKEGGLTYMGIYPLFLTNIPNGGILHFKVNNL